MLGLLIVTITSYSCCEADIVSIIPFFNTKNKLHSHDCVLKGLVKLKDESVGKEKLEAVVAGLVEKK